ncbi:MAG: neutral/alkaline non-lysosomal ceramidase N-terminal domain-containing protein [Planctomycetota bacterium]
MIQHSRWLFVLCFITVLLVGPVDVAVPAANAADTWKAGAARVRITPEQPMWMAGYGGRTAPAEGTTSELWAKALALEDAAGERAVLITLDVVGIDRVLSAQLRDRLAEHYRLERRQIAICTSHTHCGPVVGHCLSSMHYQLLDERHRALVDQYAAGLLQKIDQLVGEALRKLAPAQLAWGSGKATFAVNRRNNPEAQVPALRAAGELKGPVDHDVPVLVVKNLAGELQTIVCGYACHATVLSFQQWCADYPGFAQTELEQKHPGVIALFWAGCGADQNPLPRRTVELAKEYGVQLATAVDAVLNQQLTAIPAKLQTTYQEIPLKLGPLPSREQIQQDAENKDRYVASRARWLLSQMADDKPLRADYPYPVQTWSLGEQVQWITLGGEVVVDFALRIKQERHGPRTWVAAYTNDVMAYIPSRRVLVEGGYEGGGAMVYYGLPTVWSAEVEEQIIQEVHRQAGAK